jgi:hypothetical protein
MELHGQNHLADGVLTHGQHPTDQEGHEDTETRGTEALPEMNLVNPERIWYVFVHLGVPPFRMVTFQKPVCAERLLFSTVFHCATAKLAKKSETIDMIAVDRINLRLLSWHHHHRASRQLIPESPWNSECLVAYIP